MAVELKKDEVKLSVPEDNFISIPIRDDPLKAVMIGAETPSKIQKQIAKVLKKNSHVFAWTVTKIPEAIDKP